MCYGKVRLLKVYVFLYYIIDYLVMNLLVKLYWYCYVFIFFMKYNRKYVFMCIEILDLFNNLLKIKLFYLINI